MTFSRAALSAALVVAGLALAACGGPSGSTASTSGTVTSPSTTTSTPSTSNTTGTVVNTIVGTTPSGATDTETSTQILPPSAGPDGVPIESGAPVGQTSTTITGQTIDHIQCSQLDQLAYQTYAHLQVDVDGHPRSLPGAIGLVGPVSTSTGTTTTYAQTQCSYWLRTLSQNGVIEVDSPVRGTYTLGELFDVWGEPLSRVRVADARGRVTARVNGRRWRGNPRAIPLREHESIQLAVGRPVPPFKPLNWSVTDL